MFRHLYTAILFLLQPIAYFALARITPKGRMHERFARYSKNVSYKQQGIVIHASSVGEVIAATPLIEKLLVQYSDTPITITTFTKTGGERVTATFGNRVQHLFLPYDLPYIVKSFINTIQPKAVVVIETEIWPNLIMQLAKNNIPFIIANARLSERSTKRYLKFKKALSLILQQTTLIAAQDEVSAQRYLEIGALNEKVSVMGNLKYDLTIDTNLVINAEQLRQQYVANRPVWIAASTHEGEDEQVLQAHRELLKHYPNLLLILVPRHPQRFDSVKKLIEKERFSFCQRSLSEVPEKTTEVLLGDTMGELLLMYAISDIAFIGGSLTEVGGHNPLEALAFKVPVLTGQHTHNFPEIYQQLTAINGVEVIEDAQQLATSIDELFSHPQQRQSLAEAGYQVLAKNRGTLDRLMALLAPYLAK